MTIDEAAHFLSDMLQEKFVSGCYSVGHDEKDTIHVFEHRKGLKGDRNLSEFEGFKVTYQYIGQIRMC